MSLFLYALPSPLHYREQCVNNNLFECVHNSLYQCTNNSLFKCVNNSLFGCVYNSKDAQSLEFQGGGGALRFFANYFKVVFGVVWGSSIFIFCCVFMTKFSKLNPLPISQTHLLCLFMYHSLFLDTC
jgi:hypothetical protein